MARISWLHLSDWHQKDVVPSDGAAQDRQILADSLLRSITEQMTEEPALQKIDFVIFSGDVAFKADPAEYKAARVNLFDPLLKAVNFDRFTDNNLFLVPGNHDLDRRLVRTQPEQQDDIDKEIDRVFWGKGTTFRRDVNKLFSDAASRARLMEPFANFNKFREGILGTKARKKEPDQISYFKRLEKDGASIGVIGINSAAFCARNINGRKDIDDLGYLVVSENQIARFSKEAEKVDLCISIMHHPLSWLRESEEYFIFEELSRNAHFLLHGHEHLPRINIIESTTGDLVVVPAGSVFEARYARDPRYTNAYNFVTVDTVKREGSIYFMRWLDQGRGWRRDETVWEEGVYNFHLPNRKDGIRKKKKAALHEVRKVYGKKADQRFIKNLAVTIRQELIRKNGVTLVKLYMDRKIVLDKGDPEAFPITITHDPRIPALLKKAGINEPAFKMDAKKSSEHRMERKGDYGQTFFVDAKQTETKFRCAYWIYDVCPGEQFVGLSRFVRSFSVDFSGAEGLDYEVEPNGGFPDLATLNPKFEPGNFQFDSETDHPETKWCFPYQGFSIYWHPKG